MKLLGAIVLALVIAAPVDAFTPSLTLDQPNPVFGQAVTFTGVYPKVAQARQPQYPNQPQVQVNCSTGWWDTQQTTNKTPLGQGWNQSTYPFTLGYPFNVWTSGGASCSAVLFYFDQNGNLVELASASFEVAP